MIFFIYLSIYLSIYIYIYPLSYEVFWNVCLILTLLYRSQIHIVYSTDMYLHIVLKSKHIEHKGKPNM